MHIVQQGESLSKIAAHYGISLTKLLAANPQYKADPNSIHIGDKLIIPQATAASENRDDNEDPQQPQDRNPDYFVVPAGQLTFDAEGQEVRGKYFSRTPHVPGAWSGVTIGRGYDMRERSASEIIEDLTQAGITPAIAERLASCRGLKGSQARQFLEGNHLTDIEISPSEQRALFIQTYHELEGDVIRICNKIDVIEKYGETDWHNLDPMIRDITVDLRYRGDYTGVTREKVQPVLVSNDLDELTRVISDRDYWVSMRKVPVDRFNRRKKYVVAAS